MYGHLDCKKADGSGNVYCWKQKAMEGRLCSALLRYFAEPSGRLFIQVKECVRRQTLKWSGWVEIPRLFVFRTLNFLHAYRTLCLAH